MAQRSPVPKFGNWENGDNVPYTVYFEKARKSRNRGHKIQSDPVDSIPRPLDPPLQSDDAIGHRNGGDTLRAKHRPAGSPVSELPARVSSGKANRWRDRNSEQSSVHLSVDGGGVSPASRRERKGSSDVAIGQAPATPGRSRRGSAGDCAVPKFGEWDENDPASADGYTLIFNNVKDRRNGGSAKSLSSSSHLSNQNSLATQPRNATSESVSCFCWG